jgi:hypothetical protein
VDLRRGVGGGSVWTGDGRLLFKSADQSYVLADPRSGATVPFAFRDTTCRFGSSYLPDTVVSAQVEMGIQRSDPDMCVCDWLNVDTGFETHDPTQQLDYTSPFALSDDGRLAAFAESDTLYLDDAQGGARRELATTRTSPTEPERVPIFSVGWARDVGGAAKPPTSLPPPTTASSLAGAPPPASRSGGSDCRTGLWVNRTPSPRPPGWPVYHTDFASAFDSDRSTLIVEGGLGSSGALPDVDHETMEWAGGAGLWTNRSRPNGFGPTNGTALSYDTRQKMVLGLGAALFADDDYPSPRAAPWRWTTDLGWSNPRTTNAGPTVRDHAMAVFDAGRSRWIIAGGQAENDTWEWDGTAWQQSAAAAPAAATELVGGHLVYDDTRGYVYLFGNRDLGSTPWLYDPVGGSWSASPSSGVSPLPRAGAAVAYDRRRDRVVVFGGQDAAAGGQVLGDLWEWNPASGEWLSCASPIPAAAPSARMNGAFAYDGRRDVLTLFSGENPDAPGTQQPDLWEWYVP